jgi:hypothetical protein
VFPIFLGSTDWRLLCVSLPHTVKFYNYASRSLIKMTGRTISPSKLIVTHSVKKLAPSYRTQTLFELNDRALSWNGHSSPHHSQFVLRHIIILCLRIWVHLLEVIIGSVCTSKILCQCLLSVVHSQSPASWLDHSKNM